jgi:hypothetical protein
MELCVRNLESDALSIKAKNYRMAKRKWPETDSLFLKFQEPSNASFNSIVNRQQLTHHVLRFRKHREQQAGRDDIDNRTYRRYGESRTPLD